MKCVRPVDKFANLVKSTKAITKMVDMWGQIDSKLLKADADACASAISSLPVSGVCTEARLTELDAAFGRMSEATTFDVCKTVGLFDIRRRRKLSGESRPHYSVHTCVLRVQQRRGLLQRAAQHLSAIANPLQR